MKISRRQVFITAGAVGASTALGVGGFAVGHAAGENAAQMASGDVVPVYGAHQAGIATPAQDHLHFAAFDLLTNTPTDLRGLLQIWTAAIATMTTGQLIGAANFQPAAPPPDTGEALGHLPANLTVTVGVGPTIFTLAGEDRFGLANRRPPPLIDLPPFPREALDPNRSGGDLCVQACADDPQVAFHAVRNLARLARGLAVMRWSQLGFSRTASTTSQQETPRNLMGFKDGTDNLKSDHADLMEQHVWVQAGDAPAWMAGGTYLVARRIRMDLEAWDRDFLSDQEATIGRHKMSGAPLGGTHEFDPVNLQAKGADGALLLPPAAHVRLAIGDGTIKILRRGYSFTDGMDPQTGELDAGLFFIAFQRDPRVQFVPLQMQLASHDALNEYITHNGSAIFAVLPGTAAGGFLGETLFT